MLFFNACSNTWQPYAYKINKIPDSKNRVADYFQSENVIDTSPCFSTPEGPNVIERIGSQSSNAEVYKVSFDKKIYVAAKIMPLVDVYSAKKNKKELKIARSASKAVLEGRTQSFPLVYCQTRCGNVMLSPQSKFYIPGLLYKCIQEISWKEGYKEAARIASSMSSTEFIAAHCQESKADADILFSELAASDLAFFLNNNSINFCTMAHIFKQILVLVNDMQTILGILHNDFHYGNILVTIRDNRLALMAHDFGESKYLNPGSLSQRYVDVDKILQTLLLFHFRQDSEIRSSLLKMHRHVQKIVQTKQNIAHPILNLMEVWDNIVKKYVIGKQDSNNEGEHSNSEDEDEDTDSEDEDEDSDSEYEDKDSDSEGEDSGSEDEDSDSEGEDSEYKKNDQ